MTLNHVSSLSIPQVVGRYSNASLRVRFEIILGEFCSNLSVKGFLFELKLHMIWTRPLNRPITVSCRDFFFTLLGDSLVVPSFRPYLLTVPTCLLLWQWLICQ